MNGTMVQLHLGIPIMILRDAERRVGNRCGGSVDDSHERSYPLQVHLGVNWEVGRS